MQTIAPSTPSADRLPPLGPWSRWVMLGVLGFFLMMASGRVGNRDVAITLDLSRSLLVGSVDLPEHWKHVPKRPGGERTSQFGIGHSLSLIPYALCGRAAAALLPVVPRSEWEEFFVSLSNVPVAMLILYYLSRRWRLLGCGDRRIALGVLIGATATLIGPYAKLPFSDAGLALGVLAAWCHWMEGGWRSSMAAGLWLGVAYVSRRQADLVIPFLLVLMGVQTAVRRRWRDLLAVLLACLPALVLRMAYNQARFGTYFAERHPGIPVTQVVQQAADHPLFFNAADVLLSERHGFLIYGFVPVVVLLLGVAGLYRRSLWDGLAAVWIPLTGVLVLSELFFGPGTSFGARYLLFAIPFLLLAWPGVPIPTRGVLGLPCALMVAGSMGLMATGFVLDPLPIETRMKQSTPPLGYFTACGLEWGRVLGFGDGSEPPELRADAGWNHDPFQRPDFWWCHAVARLRDRLQRAPQIPASGK
ncbi:MAG: hypothetical protein ACKPGI_07060 [Verrucomicrobiota bacterium]